MSTKDRLWPDLSLNSPGSSPYHIVHLPTRSPHLCSRPHPQKHERSSRVTNCPKWLLLTPGGVLSYIRSEVNFGLPTYFSRFSQLTTILGGGVAAVEVTMSSAGAGVAAGSATVSMPALSRSELSALASVVVGLS